MTRTPIVPSKMAGLADVAHPPPGGGEAALVEDRDEADDADAAGELGIVERDPTGAVRPEHHPEHEERDERRHAGPRRAKAYDDAGGQHRADDQEQCPLVHGAILAARAAHRRMDAGNRRVAVAIIPLQPAERSSWRRQKESRAVKALVKARAEPGLWLEDVPEPSSRDQRRPDPGAEDGHLRHRPAHPLVGRLGAEDDPRAARDRPRVRRRDRGGGVERERLPPGRHRQRRGSRRLRPLSQLHGRAGGTCARIRSGSACSGRVRSRSSSCCR